MQKIIIQGCSLIGLIIMLGVIGVSAQSSMQYRGEIPFDFSARNVNFPAGVYEIGPMSSTSSNAGLVLRNRKTGKAATLGIIQTMSDNHGENGKMYFTNIDGRYTLSEIITPTFKKKLKSTRTDVNLVKSDPSKPKVLAIKLTQ